MFFSLIANSVGHFFRKAERQSGKQLWLCIHMHRARCSLDELTNPYAPHCLIGELGKLVPIGAQEL